MKNIIFLLMLTFACEASAQTTGEFKTQKIVQIGQIGNTENFFKQTENNNIWIPNPSEATREAIQKINFATERSTITLVVVSGKDLGISRDNKECHYLDEVIKRAEAFGLKPCLPESALQLRLDMNDQKAGEAIYVVIEDDVRNVYQISGWGCGSHAGSNVIFLREVVGTCYGEEDIFVFMLPPNG